MAITKEVIIDVNSDSAEKNLNDVVKALEQITEENKAITESQKKVDKSIAESTKATKSLAKGFTGVGLAIKAMGIDLIVSAFGTLKEVFTSNQKVADTFSAVLGTLTTLFSQVTNVVVGVIEKVSNATNGFQGLTKTIGGLITLALTPLKAAFFGIKLVIDEVRLAWEESIFGDEDPKTIKELNARITETRKELAEVGIEAVKAGKQVVDNIGQAINEVVNVVSGSIDGIKDLSVAAAFEQSKANVRLQNDAQRAAAIQAGLVEEYDRQAEKLRQIRDDESKSIEDRIKANNELGEVLNKQEQAMLAQARLQVAAAANQLKLNNTIENEVALIEARNNVKAIEAQITGFVSEQKVNENALTKEAIELAKSRNETETQLSINQKLFEAERLKDEEAKLEAQKLAMENERDLELTRLQSNIELYALGTQARIDAENEFALRKQEIDNGIIAKEDEIAQFRLNKQKEDAEKAKIIAEEERKFKEEQYRSTYDNLQNILSLGGGKLNKVAKALAIADVVRTATKSVSETVSSIGIANAKAVAASPLTGGMPFVALNTIKGALTIASTVASSIRSIQAIKGESKSAPNSAGIGGAAGGGGSAVAAPQFNTIGNTGVNQLAQTLGQQQPIQTYVVANEVTTSQSLQRNIVQNATL